MLSSIPKNENGNEDKAKQHYYKQLNIKVMSTNSNANQSEETRVYNNVKGNIVAVTLPKGIDGRVTISLDCEPFPSIDFETGEEIVKSAFGINIRNLVNQVGDKVEPIGLANALAMGKAINPQIISLALIGASIEVSRTFHAKGTQREQSEELYSKDCIVSDIVAITPHVKPMFQKVLETLVMTKPYIENVASGIVANPFGI